MVGIEDGLLATYMLIVVRLSAALVVMPMFGARSIPPQTKIGLALVMGLILLPLQDAVQPADGGALVVGAIQEAVIGAAIGFAVMLIFQGLESAGSLIGVQMGMGLGQIFDPLTGAQSTEFQRFYGVLATLIFFLVNAHHEVLRGMFATFELVPLGTFEASDVDVTTMIQLSAAMFVAAVRIALPVTAAVFVTDLSLAVIARTMPQLNVLVVGMPVKIVVGLLVLVAALPVTTGLMSMTLGAIFEDLSILLAPAQG